ncbi:MAG: NADH-quinone oxidoreductase subunit N [Gammaproteobacteria bacterium]|nr:NADH-quinone oxidoreductase subunit N [Gammaproteobacteria bacterium]
MNIINQFFNSEYGHAILIALPELALLCLATGLLVLDSFLPRVEMGASLNKSLNKSVKNYKITFWLANIVLLIILLLVVYQHDLLVNAGYNFSSESSISSIASSLINNMIVNDRLSFILKIFMILSVLISFYYSDNFLKNKRIFSGEFYAMGLFALLGMMVLVSATNMVTLYLGLELLSLPGYAMVALQRDSTIAGEAALKYFVMGAIASGILLFGISLIYGMTGSLVLADIANYNNTSFNAAFILGLVFICVGIAFKFGAAPFHMWTPDVYQGAPTPVALFISAAPKLATFGMAIRLLHEGFGSLNSQWGYVLYLIAMLSIIWGSFGALAQVNLKRLLAYSSISHMGFILLGLATSAYSPALFYMIIYALMSLAAFGFILTYGNNSNDEHELSNLEDYRGLYYKQPWLAFMLLIVLFSMAGVPPFVGFFAKMVIIQSIIKTGYYYTAVSVVLLSVVGAYYYLKLIWLMFFENPQKNSNNLNIITIDLDQKVLVSINCLLIFALGIYSQWLYTWCLQSFS